jgi:hypothetical protein
MPCARFRPVWLQKPSSEYREKVFLECQKALSWSIGGSKADLLELKVAAWAVVTSGSESEVQCIPQQMHELRPFPSPNITNYSETAFSLGVKWAPVGRGAAPCHWHWHQGPAMGESAGWTAPEPAQAPKQGHRTSPKPPDTNHDKGLQPCKRR